MNLSDLTLFPETASDIGVQIRECQVDHDAFTQTLKPCTLERCKATCCYDGVYLSQEEAEMLEILIDLEAASFQKFGLHDGDGQPLRKESIIESSPKGSKKTATRPAKEGELAKDYPQHFPKTRCVFLDSEGRCGLQMLAMEKGEAPWFYKPITCWVHPIALRPPTHRESRAVLTLYKKENDPQQDTGYPGFASCTHCGRNEANGTPAVEVLQEELKMLSTVSGRNLTKELSSDLVDW